MEANMRDHAPKNESRDEKVQTWLKSAKDDDGNLQAGNWMATLIPHISLLQTSPEGRQPFISFTFTVQSAHCNRMHSLHGGCIASIFDFATTMALALVSRPGFWQGMGVSRSLTVTYLRPAPQGTELFIECEIVQVGKTLAALKGTMRRRNDGQITATCEHCKVNVEPRPTL